MKNLEFGYESIVASYIRDCRPDKNKEHQYIQSLASLHESILYASSCLLPNGKRQPHQYRIPSEALIKVRDKLLLADFSNISTFDELHEFIDLSISNINKIGILTIYDIAHRIGVFLKIEPVNIYLHRGTREGANALGISINQKMISKESLPIPFQRLDAHELEDCLCIFKDDLWKLKYGEQTNHTAHTKRCLPVNFKGCIKGI